MSSFRQRPPRHQREGGGVACPDTSAGSPPSSPQGSNGMKIASQCLCVLFTAATLMLWTPLATSQQQPCGTWSSPVDLGPGTLHCTGPFATEQEADDAIESVQDVLRVTCYAVMGSWFCNYCALPGCFSGCAFIGEWDAQEYVIHENDGTWSACVEFAYGKISHTCSLCPWGS